MARQPSDRARQRSPLFYLGTIGAAVVIALAVSFFFAGESPEVAPEDTSNVLARDRPTGAGTQPEEPSDTLVGEDPDEPIVEPAAPSD